MKKLFFKISIFILLISACACFVFPGNNNKPVYAATTTDCNYMIDNEGVFLNSSIAALKGASVVKSIPAPFKMVTGSVQPPEERNLK